MKMKLGFGRYTKLVVTGIFFVGATFSLAVLSSSLVTMANLAEYNHSLYAIKEDLGQELTESQSTLASVSAELAQIKNEDQRQINLTLEEEIDQIQTTYDQAVVVYEDLIELEDKTDQTTKYKEQWAEVLSLLGERNYATATVELKDLRQAIDKKEAELATEFSIPKSVPVHNSPPDSGYRRQQVETEIGNYLVSLVSADLNSTRVIVDTASAEDCGQDCTVLPLSDYVGRNGAFAAVNGPYFCPASYPSCADKKNTFDTLLMNKDKYYFNSDNNVYSTVPAVIFSGNSARYVGRSLEWGRDTGVDAVIAAQPFLVSNGQVVFGGDGDPKKGSKSCRGFIGTSGTMVYIGHVHSATVAESARALHALGMQNALNLDGGGSCALWYQGYKVGPGRNLPFGILLVRK